MESSPSSSKVEVVQQAIKQMMDEVGLREGCDNKSPSGDINVVKVVDDDDVAEDNNRLLSTLMSQSEKLKGEPETEAAAMPGPVVSTSDSTRDGEGTKVNPNVSRFGEDEKEEIVKELKKVRRQNLVTHCLLSVMIVVTIAWQVSEVSIILKLKDGVSHPFRSIGSLFKGMLKSPKANGNEEETESLDTSSLVESSPLKIPELPHVELPTIDLGYEDEG